MPNEVTEDEDEVVPLKLGAISPFKSGADSKGLVPFLPSFLDFTTFLLFVFFETAFVTFFTGFFVTVFVIFFEDVFLLETIVFFVVDAREIYLD